ncbi:MAG: hypothetical protein KJO06_06175 [Gemmatimonadetes bacterium]|nr:hypothetical protein [Gemmatimonadota bacterium]
MSVIRYIPVAVLAAIVALTGCGSGTEPILIPIPDETREAVMVDVTTGSIGDPSAFDIITGESVRTDQFSGWDFVFQIAEDGSALWWPRSAIIEEDEDSGLLLVSRGFDDLLEAPEDGYVQLESVPVAVGDVFAARSRRDPALGNLRCRRYAKVEILDVDTVERTVSFRHLVNPNCEQRKLVPGAED